VRFRERIGSYFAFDPHALPHGFCVQGYDLKSAEGYQLYLCGANGKAERRFTLPGLPARLPYRFLSNILRDRINNFAASPDGTWFAAAGDLGLAVFSRDGTLRWSQDWWKSGRKTVRLVALNAGTIAILDGPALAQYDASNGKLISTLAIASAGEVIEAKSSGDGRVIAARATTDGGRIFIIRDGKLINEFPTAANEIVLSPDGKLIAAVSRSQLKVYSAENGFQWTYIGDENLRYPRFANDSARLAVSTDLATLAVFTADGAVLLERDIGAICVPAWLPNGDLMLASWMGEVRRLDATFAEKWRVVLRPATIDMRGKILTGNEPPSARLTAWMNDEPKPEALDSNLLTKVPAKISLLATKVPDGSLSNGWSVKALNDFAILTDGKPVAPTGPWMPLTAMDGFSEGGSNSVYVETNAMPNRLRVNAITLAEDPAHPESWLRDVSLRYWDEARQLWVPAQDLLSDTSLHTHKLAKPIEASKFRLGLPWGAVTNLRLGEICLHGEDLGKVDVPADGKKKAKGKK